MSDEAITNQPALAPALDGAVTGEPPPSDGPPDGAITDQGPAAPPAFAPVTPSERLGNLDFARGVALLGILFVNAASFFGPFAAMMDPRAMEKFAGIDRVAFLVVMSVFATKFISIFSMLFGYGLMGQIERAAERGSSPVWFTLRRLLALLGFGLVHALALWYGDILFIYALMGAWLLLARFLSTKWLVIVAVLLLLAAVALRGGLTFLQLWLGGMAGPPAAVSVEGPPPRGFEAMEQARFNPAAPVWIEAETAAYRDGPLSEVMPFRLAGWFVVLAVMPFFPGWQVLGMFLIGAALYRLRFFHPDRAALRRRVLLVCLPLGVAFELAAGALTWTHSPITDLWAWAIAGVVQQAGLLFLPLGYLALFALVADRLPDAVRQPVGNAGRMSLTVYLGETVLATALSYWWGLRLFGQVGSAMQMGLTVLIWLALVGFSTVWLRYFAQGPMEWLWRRLAYGRPAARAA